MDEVVHFEIPAANLKRAEKFYSSVFGWKTDDWSMGNEKYIGLITTKMGKDWMPVEPGAINGGMFKRDKIFKGPLVTIQVSDIDKAMKKIAAMGGKIVEKKMAVEKMGYSAYFKDTEGNVMGLWQDLE